MALFPKYSKTREGQNVIMEQRLLKAVNNLILNAETCTGCGICVDACPEKQSCSDLLVRHAVGQSTTRTCRCQP